MSWPLWSVKMLVFRNLPRGSHRLLVVPLPHHPLVGGLVQECRLNRALLRSVVGLCLPGTVPMMTDDTMIQNGIGARIARGARSQPPELVELRSPGITVLPRSGAGLPIEEGHTEHLCRGTSHLLSMHPTGRPVATHPRASVRLRAGLVFPAVRVLRNVVLSLLPGLTSRNPGSLHLTQYKLKAWIRRIRSASQTETL